jgi:hypothetical protein
VAIGRQLQRCGIAVTVTAGFVLLGPAPALAAQRETGRSAEFGQVTPAGPTIRQRVGPRKPFTVVIPGVGTLSGPRKAVSRRGKIVVRPYSAEFTGGVYAAGNGVDVDFSRTSLRRRLTLTQRVRVEPGAPIPVIAHRAENGAWRLQASRLVDGRRRMRVVTKRFSINIPAWVNPREWARAVGDRLAASIGGRTSPWACTSAPPGWFSVSNKSSTVHACAMSNNDAGGERGEVRIKSNRGAVLQVTLAGPRDYTWVSGQPDTLRRVVGSVTGTDPGNTVFLPPGDDGMMTVGFRRPVRGATYTMLAETTYRSVGVNLAYFAIDQVVDGVSPRVKYGAAIYALSKCSGALSLSSGVLRTPKEMLSNANFLSIMSCLANRVADELADPKKALGVAVQLVDPRSLSTQQYTNELTKTGRGLQVLKKVLIFRPLLQQGWQGAADTAAALFTNGESTHIDVNLEQGPAQNLPVPVPTSPTPVPTPTTPGPPATRDIVVYNQVTNGASSMREDTPAYLSSVTRNFCKRDGCALAGTDMGTGAQITAICQVGGDRTTNGQDNSSIDDNNPGLFSSTRWYGIRWADGRTGFISEVWIYPHLRGGLGLRAC